MPFLSDTSLEVSNKIWVQPNIKINNFLGLSAQPVPFLHIYHVAVFWSVNKLKCKICFLDELGNFKQNFFYISKCKFFLLLYTTTDPYYYKIHQTTKQTHASSLPGLLLESRWWSVVFSLCIHIISLDVVTALVMGRTNSD